MLPVNIKELEKIVKLGVSARLKRLTVGEVVIEFGEITPETVPVFRDSRASQIDDELKEPTEDELLNWSTGLPDVASRSEAPS